jgi:hypothetical protein
MAAGVYLIRTPIRNASKIKPGDSAAQVHELLGEPDEVFATTEQLRTSYLGPMSYVFTERDGRSGIALDDLPPVVTRAEWFEYGSAGHLVYYNEQGVVDVLWGGT